MEINFECFSDSADSLFGSIVVVPGDPNQSIVVNETQFQDLELDELLAPNGGEQFVLGGNVNVTWSTDHVESWHSPALAVVDLVDLYYSTDDGINWTVEAAGLDAATGSHSFVAGTSHTALQARIKVVFRHSSGIVFGEDVSNASFQVDDPAVFSNESANVNFLWAGDPYASIAADLDGDGDQDLFVTDQGAGQDAGWMQHNQNSAPNADLPFFDEVAASQFDSSQKPTSLRGAVAADMDNDGDLDIFAAAALVPRLYQNTGGSPTYSDIGPALSPPLDQTALDSWVGAWGDYDRDGRIDLFIGRALNMGNTGFDALPDVLLHNDGGGQFSDASTSMGVNVGGEIQTSHAVWADYDGDENLDLFLGSASEIGGYKLYRNWVWGSGAMAFQDKSDLVEVGTANYSVEAAAWADMNNDGHLDLIIARESLGSNLRITLSDGLGGFQPASVLLGPEFPVASFAIFDQDLDGALDILATKAESTSNAPMLLRNNPANPGISFTDVTVATGLDVPSANRVETIAVADFGGSLGTGQDEEDGDLDIYFGRPPSALSHFYQAKVESGADTPANQWLRVQLTPNTADPYYAPVDGYGNNSIGVGARVTVQIPEQGVPTWQQVQSIDSSGGTGAQSGTALTFGLGAATESALVTVVWPDGFTYQQIVTPAEFNSAITIEIPSTNLPDIVESTMIWGQLPRPDGTTDWEFLWQTENAGDPILDRVFVIWTSVGSKKCNLPVGAPIRDGILLNPESPNVEHSVEVQVNGRYQHKLLWKDRGCYASCAYNWTAASGITSLRTEGSSLQTFTVPMCMN